MGTLNVAEVVDVAFEDEEIKPVEKIEETKQKTVALLSMFPDLIDSLDWKNKASWRGIIMLARTAGVSDDEIQAELGASPATIHRWLNDGVAPREGTRRLMQQALVTLARQKVDEVRARFAS